MDLADLRPVLSAEGPFATVHLDSESAVADAPERLALRWRDAERQLVEAGVGAETVQAFAAGVGDHALGGTRVLVAAGGELLLATSLPAAPVSSVDVRVGALPHLLPLVAAVTGSITYVLVKADRRGADLVAVRPDLPDTERRAEGPATFHLTKTRGGGWATKRHENRVEQQWERNAKEVAAQVDALAREVGADLVVATGDSHELTILAEELPERLRDVFVVVPGGRSADGSEELVEERVAVEVARVHAERREALLGTFAEEAGQDDRAAVGPAATVQALRRGQAETLLLSASHLSPGSDAPGAWFAPDPSLCALDRADLVDLGVERPRSAPLADVLLRAAVATGARVAVVAEGEPRLPEPGVGAVLRFATTG